MKKNNEKVTIGSKIDVYCTNQYMENVISAIMAIQTEDKLYKLEGMEYGIQGVQGIDSEDGTDTMIPYCIIMSIQPVSTSIVSTLCMN